MSYKRTNYVIAGVIFLLCSAIYIYTMQPTLSFWNCGEFIASAFTVSVPHPPGAPLWILAGKLATLMPFGSNPAVKMNSLSAIFSGMTAAFLYLVIVSVIKNWKGFPENSWDAVTVFGSAAIGALSYAFSDAFWFNAIESEVYSMTAMLIGLSVLLLMKWWENADNKGNEKILLVLAFVAGLSLGIHLLAAQIALVAGMMYYFRRYEFKISTFAAAFIITCLAFFVIYPVISIYFPVWIGSGLKPLNISHFTAVIIAVFFISVVTICGIYYATKNGKKNLAVVFAAIFLVFLGYSIYTSVILRARVDNLPINENNPGNISSLAQYMSRGQYGDAPIWPRRYSQAPEYRKTFTNYSGNFDFLWRYQVNHMFNRYLGWQYIGRAGYNPDQGIDWNKFYGIPFLIGLFGLFYHFRKDWKLGFTFLWMFILMGVLTALYQRQQEPQPRERDYFYIGAFFVYSMWIGIGVMGILELIREAVKNSSAVKAAGVAVLLFSFIFIPINMFRINFHYHNRHDNYVPFDYAYNLLQSADKDAIIFTDGDNNTFPLWYLQTAEGYRTDVKVINLSLLNEDWYIKQLKDSMPLNSSKVPMNLTDEQIKQLQPMQWGDFKPVTISVPPDAYPDSLKSSGTDKLTWKMPYTFISGTIKGIKVQDQVILEILKSNNWQRPVFFPASVAEENYIGLDDYLVTEGLLKRLVPFKPDSPTQFRVDEKKMSENFMAAPSGYSKNPQRGYFFRGFDNPNIFFDQTAANIVQNYRSQFLTFAYYYINQNNEPKALEVLSKMEAILPEKVVEMDYKIEYDVAMIYNKLGEKNKFNDKSPGVEKAALEQLNKNPNDINSYWNPYKILIDIYEARGDYSKAIDILNRLDRMSPNNPDIKEKIESLNSRIKNK
jgi:hypothetical protein